MHVKWLWECSPLFLSCSNDNIAFTRIRAGVEKQMTSSVMWQALCAPLYNLLNLYVFDSMLGFHGCSHKQAILTEQQYQTSESWTRLNFKMLLEIFNVSFSENHKTISIRLSKWNLCFNFGEMVYILLELFWQNQLFAILILIDFETQEENVLIHLYGNLTQTSTFQAWAVAQ